MGGGGANLEWKVCCVRGRVLPRGSGGSPDPLGSTKTGSLGKSYITSAMASKACVMRLGKEHQRLGKEPVPNIEAEPR